jgi:hypothetical protein
VRIILAKISFLWALLVAPVILILFPTITLWIPNLLKGGQWLMFRGGRPRLPACCWKEPWQITIMPC